MRSMLICIVFIPFLHMVILPTMLSINQIRLIYEEISYILGLACISNIALVAFYRNIFILDDKRMLLCSSNDLNLYLFFRTARSF